MNDCDMSDGNNRTLPGSANDREKGNDDGDVFLLMGRLSWKSWAHDVSS